MDWSRDFFGLPQSFAENRQAPGWQDALLPNPAQAWIEMLCWETRKKRYRCPGLSARKPLQQYPRKELMHKMYVCPVSKSHCLPLKADGDASSHRETGKHLGAFRKEFQPVTGGDFLGNVNRVSWLQN